MRKRLRLLFLSCFLVPVLIRAQTPSQPVDAVNVFTGTSNSRWMLFPGACLPQGMVQLSPDNQQNVWNGGYEYTLGSISGFSHIHEMSLGGVSIMPVVGKLDLYPGQPKTFGGTADGPFGTMWTAGFRSRFRREDETGKPGYYSVKLLDYDIQAELTTTTRCGLMRLTFPKSETARLVFDFAFPQEEKTNILDVRVTRRSPQEIEGSIHQKNKYAQEYTVHFVTQLSRPFETMQTFRTQPYTGTDTNYSTEWRDKQQLSSDTTAFRGSGTCGILLNFATKAGEQVLVRTGISYVSVENARLNLTTEMKPFGWNFDAVATHARQVWNELLSRVDISGGSPDDRTKFYTNFYRAYTVRGKVSDVDGSYTDGCGQRQTLKAPADAVYSSDGFWGAQWNLAPLWTLLTPEYASSWVNALLTLADKGGWLPEAPVALKYAPIMGAQHHNALIISAYQKGIRTFDVTRSYNAIRHDLTTPGQEHTCGGYAGNRHLAPYLELGYVPDEVGPASNTLEYAYDDWCMAQFAKALGKPADEKLFTKRAQSYRNQFDPATKSVRRRYRDGRWAEPFDPHLFGTTGGWNGPGFVEGTAWLYSFFVPHDLPGLMQIMGKEEFNRRLEEGFDKGYVDLTNQPNLQAPFLFNYSGKPWLTQRYSRYVVDSLFNTSPYQGWLGEEDEGQMGAFCSLLMMGLFEMDGGCSTRPYYDLSSPVFSQITLRLNPAYYPGKTFTIEARNNSSRNRYIQLALLNGKPLTKPVLYHDELVKGGKLVLQMGDKPNRQWGITAP